jgi:hypothetical protein
MFDTGVQKPDGTVRLCLHIGVGCGEVTILQVGGHIPPECTIAKEAENRIPRYEYVIAGEEETNYV